MASDKLLADCSTHFPNALAKFVRAAAGDYEAKS
jgi:hypothetical protein